MMKKLQIQLIVIICFITATCLGQNVEFKPGEIWPDNNGKHINVHGGGIMYYNDTYYWYGEFKEKSNGKYRAGAGVRVYTSNDLYNWKDGGIVLKPVENDTMSDITRGCILERPKVIYNQKTKKFVMWFHLELRLKGYDAARVGVATADNPFGPFIYIRSFRPNAKTWPINVQPFHKRPVASIIKDKYCGGLGCLPAHPDSLNILGRDFESGQMSRDMNLFVDDDGKAYLISASEENSTTHISQLNDDYLGCSDKFVRVFVNRYMEAGTMFKTSTGTYFFIASDCTGWAPNAARSAWSPSIWGPWTESGNPCGGKDSALTFNSQSTFILPYKNKKDAFIFMGDRWFTNDSIDGRHIWLPIKINNNKLEIKWFDNWNLKYFTQKR